MGLTNEQQSVLVGTVLGDAYLQRTGVKNARIRLEHGADQHEYLKWKVEQFPQLFSGPPTKLSRIHPLTKSTYHYWRHQSRTSPLIGVWRKLFYPSGKKKIPPSLSRLLTPLALAVWYMDDGYYYAKEDTSYLYLGRVSAEEAEIARIALLKVFDLKATVYDKGRKGFALYFPKNATHELHRAIASHVHEHFGYKLSPHLEAS